MSGARSILTFLPHVILRPAPRAEGPHTGYRVTLVNNAFTIRLAGDPSPSLRLRMTRSGSVAFSQTS